jgi:hypothetical protein
VSRYDPRQEISMKSSVIRVLLAVAVTTALGGTLHAKGPTVKLTVIGPRLSHPLDITDSHVLMSSQVFAGAFLGGESTAPDASLPRYKVSFHVELPRWMNAGVQVKYVVLYAKDSKTGRGFVYLPGRGEDGYRLNVGTIMRDGQDGMWHAAASDWAARLNAYLP